MSSLCHVYLCSRELTDEYAQVLSFSSQSFSKSFQSSPCKTFMHWSLELCYDNGKTYLCEANEDKGKLKSLIRGSSGEDKTMTKLNPQKVYLGKHLIEKGRLMDLSAELDTDEDYNPVTNNCQHFVKKLLKKLGIDFMNHLSMVDRLILNIM